MALIGFGIGALPWLWSNIPDGFLSIDSSRVALPGSGGYLSHLHVFFVDVLPLQLGVHRTITGAQLLPGALGLALDVLIFGALIASLAVCLLQGGRGRAIAVGVIAFPFLYALNPLGAFWYDGRYSEYLPPLAALTLAMGCERLPRLLVPRIRSSHAHSRMSGTDRARSAARAGVSLLVVALVASAAAGFASIVSGNPHSVLARDPNATTEKEIALLEEHGIRFGYANYWVAYKLDYLSGGALNFTPTPWDQVRSPSIAAAGRTSRATGMAVRPARRSPPRGHAIRHRSICRPASSPRPRSNDRCSRAGITYSIVHAGFFDAIVPQRTLAPRQTAFG